MEKNDSLKYIKESFDLKNQKLYKEAIEVLYKVLSKDTDQKTVLEVVVQIGDLHLLLKNKDRAKEQYKKALDIDSNHTYSKNRLFEIYFEEKNYEQALQMAEEICINSSEAQDYVNYFNALLKLGKKDSILEKYETLDPLIKEAPCVLYIISLIRQDEKKQILEKIVSKEDFLKAKYDLGVVYFEEGNYEGAKKLLQDVLKKEENAEACYYIALIEITEDKFFKAIDNLNRAIKLTRSKNVHTYYYTLAKTYMEINWFEEAINTIRRSITLCIEQGGDKALLDERYLFLAWAFEKQGDYDNALFNLRLISNSSALKNQALILSALIDYKKGNVVNAKYELENLYLNEPMVKNDLTLLDTLGAIYRELKLNAKAEEFYLKHLEQFPDSIHTVSEYVDLLIDIGNYDKAEEYIKKYTSQGRIASFYNSYARIYFRKEEYEKTIDFLNKLLELDKNVAETHYFKGLSLNKLSRYKEASDSIKNALELDPTKSKYYAQMSFSKWKLGLFRDGMLYIKEAIEIDPDDLNYKKQALDIAKESNDQREIEFWTSIVKNTENVIRQFKRL